MTKLIETQSIKDIHRAKFTKVLGSYVYVWNDSCHLKGYFYELPIFDLFKLIC